VLRACSRINFHTDKKASYSPLSKFVNPSMCQDYDVLLVKRMSNSLKTYQSSPKLTRIRQQSLYLPGSGLATRPLVLTVLEIAVRPGQVTFRVACPHVRQLLLWIYNIEISILFNSNFALWFWHTCVSFTVGFKLECHKLY
jgi:hypothetical protein